MIERLPNKEVYNPIRDHISINFKKIDTIDSAMNFISIDLLEKSFDTEKSRVLIFAPTRKKTEHISELLNKKLKNSNPKLGDKIDFYHAGLDGNERTDKYEQFNSGDIVILVATKAFGMGMDIKNIHFIYHVEPASTFEDYLQEVGRAGRHKKMLVDAGFSSKNPIQTVCLFMEGDFKKLKDKLHNTQITWEQLKEVKEVVFEYVKQFKNLKVDTENAFALPLDLLEQQNKFEDKFNVDTFFRVSLYWLEKLDRISLGVYTPTQLPIEVLNNDKHTLSKLDTSLKKQLISLHKELISYQKYNFPDSQFIMIEMNKLSGFVPKLSPSKLLSLLFRAQRQGLIIIDRNITLEPTKTRTDELKKWTVQYNNDIKSPIIEATFELAYEILSSTKLGDQISFNGDYLDEIVKEISENNFVPDKIFWKQIETKNNQDKELTKEEIVEKIANDFNTKRSKFAFKIINFLPNIQHKTITKINPDNNNLEITQLVYNGHKKHDDWKILLSEFREKLYTLIQIVSEDYIKKNIKKFNIVDLIIRLKIEDYEEDYFKKLVFIVKSLAYLKGGGSLIPMGIELFIKDSAPFKEKDQSSNDYNIFNEFIESNQMRELRLLALECLSDISSEEHDTYIKNYFAADSVSNIIRLLEEKIGEDHDNLKAFRTIALKNAKEELNEEQRKVYDAPKSQNLQVIAGPGSGKTHTLTLRVAKLIQEEKVNPNNILVLAYNRAVVVELKDRLERLFRALGYGKLIKRLKVFTFHGFCKFCLSKELDNLDFDQWTKTFIKKAKSEPGLIAQKIGTLKYVFVDEFQDITSERLDLLKLIANPKTTKVCVIGDPNQSIYGYERLALGDTMDPKPLYERFEEIYKPQILNLVYNYRSYPEILVRAEQLLSLNKSKFDIPKLKAVKEIHSDEIYCHIIEHKAGQRKWSEWLHELIDAKQEGLSKYAQIAIMFRTNDEVYKGYNTIKEKYKNLRIRIQGSSSSPNRSREFYHFLRIFDEKANELIEGNFILIFETEKKLILEIQPNWDKYLLNLFHCILIEFNKLKDQDAIYAELIEFIEDIAYRDDGQFGKIYDNNISSIDDVKVEQEIVITTMHKVKGIEYEAVIIPPSFARLPLSLGKTTSIEAEDIEESIEEERRLQYVAYTRSKYKLVVIKHNRELSLDKGEKYELPIKTIDILGVKVKEGIDKLNIGWAAKEYNEKIQNVYEKIDRNIKIGSPIELRKNVNQGITYWDVYSNNINCGQLKPGAYPNTNKEILKGFLVSSVERYTYKESLKYDEKNNRDLARKWCQESKDRGFIYLVDFAGFGK